jgi:aspartate/methionine/tyrosine aminotransferase
MTFEKYPFEKLNELLGGIKPPSNTKLINLTIGEPQFETPKLLQDAVINNIGTLKKYPKSAGEDLLKQAIIRFNELRFGLKLLPTQVIPTFGTREVLFNFPQFLLDEVENPTISFTNPFYQIYEGAALASKSKVHYINLTKENNFQPLIDDEVKSSNLVILNFPNNPTGADLSLEDMKKWVEASLEYDFVLLNDECYSEIYDTQKPPSILKACLEVGNDEFKNVLCVNSLSKRSSAPGLRGGFIAGDEAILKNYMKYRTYIGCAVPVPLQMAQAVAWADDVHSEKIRRIYVRNQHLAREILGIEVPQSTFYIWLEVEDELEFTKKLYEKENIKVLPGSFLGRENQGKGYVRIALVQSEDLTTIALEKLKKYR